MDFTSTYDRNEYLKFFRNQFLPEDFEQSAEEIAPGFQPQYTRKITKIGRSDALDLNVYEIRHGSENDPRVSLSKECFRLLSQYGQSRALVLLVPNQRKAVNYRLSLVTIDLTWEEGTRPTKEYSNPRRLSFFLGSDAKTHTPQQYLVKPGRITDFDDLKDRFSIEVVNKHFYIDIAKLFTKLTGGTRKIGSKSLEIKKGQLVFPRPDEITQKEFAVRLIGRLVFCWFLKKKHSEAGLPLLPEEVLSTAAIKANTTGLPFYHGILEPLFFEVLNTPVGERNKKFRQKSWSIIPFLNGGLFTPHEDDFYKPDLTGISRNLNILSVPDKWLTELMEIFETYNFTIDENTSVDVELSIDPEMLGRIFENLLADINPETGETARKATGSYYTPRPIVEYMVDESLKQYLLTKTKIPEDKLTALLSYADEEPRLTDSQKDALLDALHTIKIIDPACGSGAFPMGILQKILLILQKIDPKSKLWLDKLLSSIPDPLYRKELKKKIKVPNYLHKLGIIRDCIYGVDIQPIAVEIAKLRCFLSLIVDEHVDDDQENRGVEHLPNLEFKFVCANTLIGLPALAEKGQQTMFEAADEITELKELRDQYLRSYGQEKQRIEERFKQVQSKMFDHSLQWQNGKESQTSRLSQWQPFSDEACPWFDPEWMFGINDCFDIVIANPPYVFTRKGDFSKDFKSYVKKQYFNILEKGPRSRSKQSGKINLFGLFLMKGLMLTKDMNTLTFILPNTILRTTTYDLIRKYVLDTSRISQIVDLGGGVFDEVTAATIIFVLQKHREESKREENVVKILYEINNLSTDFSVNTVCQKSFNYNISYLFNIYVDGKILDIINKISICPNKLGKFTVDIIEGIVAHKHLIVLNKVKDSYPLLEGKNVKKYFLEKPNKFIIWDISKIHRTRPDYLWRIQNKIVIQRISGGKHPLVAALDAWQHRTFASINNLVLKKEYEKYYKYILALLNSKAINFFYCNNFSNKSNLTVNISKTFLESLPVPEIEDRTMKMFDALIDKIKGLNDDGKYMLDYTSKLKEIEVYQRQIDRNIYKLYNLSSKEIDIIENQ